MNNTRVIPFVIGVTSFGAACGFSVPGVYTRVAPYIPWIFNVLKERGERVAEWMFQPEACATDYAELRENDPPVDQDGTNLVEYQDLGRVLVLEQKNKMRQILREQQLALNRCEDKTERLCVD
ncbi:uncharacterized protein LOC131263649 [Anopheles coustani]|uniref:uncharacterized protein LOC131263649 n=1 Tax=Anopheles coustani TaxID=139045 RepID=UPI00265814C3|nr:uncharacterized protein LOC131263649 [Anopheles coustani]